METAVHIASWQALLIVGGRNWREMRGEIKKLRRSIFNPAPGGRECNRRWR